MTFPPQAWREYQRHRGEIAGLLDPRCYSIEWLDAEVLNDRARCFGTDDAVIVTEVRTYPAGANELHGLVAAGTLSSILSLIEDAEAWARRKGITFASIASREGWSRVLKPRGYAVHQIELRKELA